MPLSAVKYAICGILQNMRSHSSHITDIPSCCSPQSTSVVVQRVTIH